jgi:hypothetical protein
VDDEKTRVMQRPVPSAQPAAPPPPPKPAPPKLDPQARPASVLGLTFRYCPACTSPNPLDAVTCSKCRTPLPGNRRAPASAPAPPPPKTTPWALYAAIAVAAVLAIALIVVVMTK